MRHIVFEPPGPVAKAFMKSEAPVRLLLGPWGSGKSSACCAEILRRSQLQLPSPDGKRRSRWAIIRNTLPMLRTTTMQTWWNWMPREIGQWIDSGPPRHRIRSDELDIEIVFLALDLPGDVDKLLSLELTGAWINEAKEIPWTVMEHLLGRVGRYPAMRDGGPTWSGVILDTNPPDTDHWIYRKFEEERPSGWEFFRQPSGLSPDAENIHNLKPGYYEGLVPGRSEEWVKINVHAEYGFAQDGKPIYPEYVDALHCQEVAPLPGVPLHVGLDFGLTPAAVIGQRTASGAWRILDEICGEDLGVARFAPVLKARLLENFPGATLGTISGDPAGEQRAQTDETTVYQILRASGLPARPAPSNDFTSRRESVARLLSRLDGGMPSLVIHPRCKRLRQGFLGGYRYRRLQIAGQERFEDRPEKGIHSHPHDALQYLLLGAGEGQSTLFGPSGREEPEIITDYNPFP